MAYLLVVSARCGLKVEKQTIDGISTVTKVLRKEEPADSQVF